MAARGKPRHFEKDATLQTAMMTFWQRGFEETPVACPNLRRRCPLPPRGEDKPDSARPQKETQNGRSIDPYHQFRTGGSRSIVTRGFFRTDQ